MYAVAASRGDDGGGSGRRTSRLWNRDKESKKEKTKTARNVVKKKMATDIYDLQRSKR